MTMVVSLRISVNPLGGQIQCQSKPISKHSPRCATIRCTAAAASTRRYTITLLPGDGIGPEVISVAKTALQLAGSLEGSEFGFKEMPMGGAALDLTGVPLPEKTLSTAQQSNAVLLEAIEGYKYTSLFHLGDWIVTAPQRSEGLCQFEAFYYSTTGFKQLVQATSAFVLLQRDLAI